MYKIMKNMQLQYKIMILTVLMVCFVLLTAGGLVISGFLDYVESSATTRALDIARMVAETPVVSRAILSDHPSVILQPITERWRIATGAAFIVISNMDQVRLTHPITANLGTPMADLYREPVLRGQEYIYKGKGSLAPALRANVPIFSPDGGPQIGFVSVGVYLDEIYAMGRSLSVKVLYALFAALCVSGIGAMLLAGHVKRAIFGLEPYEIAMILKERTATLESIREGVVAVDLQGRIRIMNSEAASILGVNMTEACGQLISDFLPQNKLDAVIRTGQAIYDEEQRVQDISILANSIPIQVEGSVRGAVITFRDRTEMVRLAEELTGVNRFVDTLRAQAHEFKNQLHTVAGLIQLERYPEAVNFIIDHGLARQGMFAQISSNIKNSVVFGLLLGKASHAREKQIEFSVSPDSSLNQLPPRITTGDVVLILGNLIENAVEAVAESQQKRIMVSIHELAGKIMIRVRNSGPWISAQMSETIYRRGVTTKRGSRGYGLALIVEKLKMSGGSISHSNLASGGVEFTVCIPCD